MKVICINVSNSKKHDKGRISYTKLNVKQDDNSFLEIIFPLEYLNKRVFEYNKGCLGKIKGKLWDKSVISKIKKYDYKELYILSKNLDKQFDKDTAMYFIKAHITSLMDRAGLKQYSYSGNIKNNIDKYIVNELEKHKIVSEDAKLLLLYEDFRKIDYALLENLAKKYKIVDIMAKNYDKNKFNENIEKINNSLGCSISITNRTSRRNIKKSDYNLYLCMDANKNKFNITNLNTIDLSDNDIDKYDKYAVYANQNNIYKRINNEYYSYATKNYGRLKILSILCKTENLT